MEEKLRYFLKIIFKGILEVIYPKDNRCIICKEEDVEGICNNCKSKIIFCEDTELCIGYYKGPLKELILKFKYKKDFNAGDVLINFVEKKLRNVSREYFLTYIPMGKKSFKERGFNQCEYIATELGFRNNFRVIDTLVKIKETKVQKTLSREERKANLIGAFKVKNKKEVVGKKFILIDDVVTTGSTLKEAKKILKENGAIEIKILTLAKSHI